MALLSRVKSPDWQDGDTLTAADLKAEFNNIVNGLNGSADVSVLTLTTSGNATIGGNASVTGNADVTGNVSAARVTANAALLGLKSLGAIQNLGLTLSTGTLTVTDATGSALGNTNPGYVCVPNTTAGLISLLQITAAASIKDAASGASHFTNTEFGTSSGSDWASAMPFFLYVVNKGNNNVTSVDGGSCFAIARNPAMRSTPSAANNIGDKSAGPVTDDQTSIILLGSSMTKANYTSLPCQLIGAIRMTYTTSGHDWTIATLGNNDGLGLDQLRKTFATQWTFPQAQGAASGTHWLNNGGTAPTFTSNNYEYGLTPDGFVECSVYMTGDGGTDGSGAVSAELSIPYKSVSTYASIPLGVLEATGTGITGVCAAYIGSAGQQFVTLDKYDTTPVLNSHFGNGSRSVFGSIRYKAY